MPMRMLTILLGKGDGSFTAGWSTALGVYPFCIAAGDFNGDGDVDLAIGNGNGTVPGTVTILLGKGDGTFSSAAGSPITISTSPGTSVSAISVGDFNGDGKLDLLSDTLSVLLGNGDGTFTVVTPSVVAPSGSMLSTGSGNPWLLTVGDFNGDGTTDLAGADAILLSATETATATVNGVVVAPGTGSQLIAASYTGDSNYKPSVSFTISQPAAQGTPTVNVAASANPAPFGSSVTLTATVAGSGLLPTGTVTFYNGSAQLGTGQLNSSGVATFATSALPVGSDSITASYGGDANYIVTNSAPLVVSVIVVGATTSTIKVTPPSSSITTSQSLTVSVAVSGAAGSPVPTGTVTLAGDTFTAQQPLSSGTANFTIAAGSLNTGVTTLTASYSGDATYAAVSGTATVTVAAVGIAISAPSPVSPGTSASATVTVTAGSAYSGTIQLSCALTSFPVGAQSQPTCSLNPTSIALKSGANGTSVMTVATTAASSTASVAQPFHKNIWGLGGGGALLALLFMCGIPSRRRRWISTLCPVLVVVVTSIAIGCGSGHIGTVSTNPATTTGKYTFTVTGTDSTSAAITTATTVTITVQ